MRTTTSASPLILAALLLGSGLEAAAQPAAAVGHSHHAMQHDMAGMEGMSAAPSAHGHAAAPAATPVLTPVPTSVPTPVSTSTEHSQHSQHGAAASTAAQLRDANAYADGFVRGSGPYALPRYHLGDEHPYALLRVDSLDWGRAKNGKPNLAFDGQWSWGSSYQRLLLQSEGHIAGGKLQEAQSQVLWSRAIAPFWNGQLGLRMDKNTGPNRQWLVLGLEGVAPYWLELQAHAYWGQGGRSALRLEAEYDAALSQKWHLQPSLEAQLYGKRDAGNGWGGGLATLKGSLRLRYAVRPDLAPYIGLEREQKMGATANLARAAGQKTGQTRYFAGWSFWF